MALADRARKLVGPMPPSTDPNVSTPNPLPRRRYRKIPRRRTWRAVFDVLAMLGALVYATWLIYWFTAIRLPAPRDDLIPDSQFSEMRARRAMAEIFGLGNHEFGSFLLEYVTYDHRRLLEFFHPPPEVELESEFQIANRSWVDLEGPLFDGRTIFYDSLQNYVVRISPRNDPEAKQNAILVSSHLDATKFTSGAGDCTSNAGVMSELVRNLAVKAAGGGYVNAVIFLWNTGEEEGLMGAHAFMTQHPWAKSVKAFLNLEAMGVGGRSSIFQAGPSSWLLNEYRKVAPHPAASVIAQDVFSSGLLNAATDFQVYCHLGGLQGMDFAFTENAGVYHTARDDVALVRNGSLQHLGENLNAFLDRIARSPDLADQEVTPGDTKRGVGVEWGAVYFDVLGLFLVVIPTAFARLFSQTVAIQAALIVVATLVFPQNGRPLTQNPKSFLLTFCALGWTVVGAISLPLCVAFLLPHLCYFPLPYLQNPWLVLFLFGCPAFAGSLVGHSVGRRGLLKHLAQARVQVKTIQRTWKGQVKPAGENATREKGKGKRGQEKTTEDAPDGQALSAEMEAVLGDLEDQWEADRWLFTGGLQLWFLILLTLMWLDAGSAYLALTWLAVPAVVYGFLEGPLSPEGLRGGELKWVTLLASTLPPLLLSAEPLLRLPAVLIGSMVRVDRAPGTISPWVPNAVIAVLVAVLVLACLAFILPYTHRSGARPWLVGLLLMCTAVSIAICHLEWIAPFGAIAPRAVAVVNTYPDLANLAGRRVNWRQIAFSTTPHIPTGVLSISSLTPGPITRDLTRILSQGITCSAHNVPDLVSYTPRYACTAAVLPPTNMERKDIAKTVTNMEVLADVGEGALGADKWREEIRWWPLQIEEGDEEGEGEGEEESDVWEEHRESTPGPMVNGSGRVTRVGVFTGISRRWSLGLDAKRIQGFSIGGIDVQEEYTEYIHYRDTTTVSASNGWHFIEGRVRYDEFYYIHRFILTLYWKPQSEGATSSPPKRPLLKIRSDYQEWPSSLDAIDGSKDMAVDSTINSLPNYFAQFGKSSMPFNQAYVDELFLD